jgi:hypothetical protein
MLLIRTPSTQFITTETGTPSNMEHDQKSVNPKIPNSAADHLSENYPKSPHQKPTGQPHN